MRVAMIDPSLFTLPYDQGLAGGLQRAGHQVTLHGRRPGPEDGPALMPVQEDFYRVANSRTVRALPSAPRLAVKAVDHAVSMAALLARLHRAPPDVIHFQWLAAPLLDRPLLAGFHRVAPLVLTVHDSNPFNGDAARRLQAMGFFGCLRRFGRLIVHTAQAAERLAARGVAEKRILVLPHGPLASPVAGAPDPMRGRLRLVLFGKIKPYKGADVLVEAMALLPVQLREQAMLHIIGKPYMDLDPLRARAAACGVALQLEPRFVDETEIDTIFGTGAVAVFPYREIDSSGVLSQALARGRPVVASRIGAFAETLEDGVHGHLVPPDDPAALAAALAHMLEDRVFAAGAAAAALALAQAAPGWDDIARRTAAGYAVLRAGAPGSSRATVISSSTRNNTGGNC